MDFTRLLFEDRLAQRQFKPRILIKNKGFIGVYRYCPDLKRCLLTFKISRGSYKIPYFTVKESGPYEKDGHGLFESSLVDAEEVHFIPAGYDLRRTNDRSILVGCLGGDYFSVHRKLFMSIPNERNLRFDW